MTADDLTACLKALACPQRLQILAVMQTALNLGVTTSDLASELPLSQPTVSHHTAVLRDAGLITSRKHGTFSIHRAVPERLKEMGLAIGGLS